MTENHQQILHLQPHMIPELRAAFKSAVDQLNEALVDLGRRGFLPTPWLGDEVSSNVAAHYVHQAMAGPQSSYRQLVAYQSELNRVYETLTRMEDEYRRADQDASTDLRRRS